MILDNPDSPNTSSNNSEFSFGGKVDIKLEASDMPPTSNSQMPLLSPWSNFYASAGFPTTASNAFPFPSPSTSFALAVGALGGDINAGWSEFTTGLSPGPTPMPLSTTFGGNNQLGNGQVSLSGGGSYFQGPPAGLSAKSYGNYAANVNAGPNSIFTSGGRGNGLYNAMLSDERGGVKPARTMSGDGSVVDGGLDMNGSRRTSSSGSLPPVNGAINAFAQQQQQPLVSTGGPGPDATSYFSSTASSPVQTGNILQQQQQLSHPPVGTQPFDIAHRIISHPSNSSLHSTHQQHQFVQPIAGGSMINRNNSRSPASQHDSPSISPAILSAQPSSSASSSFGFAQPSAWSHYHVPQHQLGNERGHQRIHSISGSSMDGRQLSHLNTPSPHPDSGMDEDHSDAEHDSNAVKQRRTSRGSNAGGRAPIVTSPGEMDDDDEEAGGEGVEKNGMMWGMKTEDYKALNARERKRVRNRISARTFRARRKEHLTSLESTLGDKDSVIKRLQDENAELKKRLAKLEGGKPYERPAGRR